jgi:hypothetical protein
MSLAVFQTARNVEPVTRVPEASRGGHARHSKKERAARLRSNALARDSSRPRKRRAPIESRRQRIAARRPPMRQRTGEADATGIGWCRRAAGRKPHSRARISGSKGVPARRERLQKSASGAEAQRSVFPAGNGTTWTGAQLSRDLKRTRGGAKASRAGATVAKPRSLRSPEPGARKGVAGQRSSIDGRHLGSSLPAGSVTRSGWGRSWRPSRERKERELHGLRGGGDRGVRGPVHTHRGGKTTPTAVKSRRGATWDSPKRPVLP